MGAVVTNIRNKDPDTVDVPGALSGEGGGNVVVSDNMQIYYAVTEDGGLKLKCL